MKRAGFYRALLARAFSLIEALLAITVLAGLLLAWGTAMIIATDAENKAGTHSEAISTANEILEYMRRDPNFWSSASGEYVSGSCPHCWPTSYNDTVGVTTPRACSTVITGASASCTFNWVAIADPNSNALAHLAVVVFFTGANHQVERYTVMGMARQS